MKRRERLVRGMDRERRILWVFDLSGCWLVVGGADRCSLVNKDRQNTNDGVNLS